MPVCRRFVLCCALLLSFSSKAAELVILVDTATEMPMARFERYRLVDGMHRDVGVALAKAMGREPRFVALPRKRIVAALQSGSADVLCGFVPEWLDGNFAWSQPFLPFMEVVISASAAERPHSLAELAGQPLGTVLGYAYPALERALGKSFVRVDGPSTELNLRKLAAGRLSHVVTMSIFVEHRIKLGDPALELHPPLLVKNYMGRCAVSLKGRVTLAQVERAVSQIQRDGTVAAMLARYQ
jgi:polar amino acid transport system substrate-binding protein